MRKLLTFIVTIIVILLLLHIALYVFINVKGRDLLKDAIRKNLNAEADVEKLSLKFPFIIEIRNFTCQDLSIKRATLSLSLSKITNFPLTINTIYIDELRLKVTKNKEGFYLSTFNQKDQVKDKSYDSKTIAKPDQSSESTDKDKEKDFSFTVKNLYCNNATVELVLPDLRKPANIVFSDIDLQVHNFKYPQLPKFLLNLKASVLSPDGDRDMQDTLSINGEVDWLNKDLDMTVDITNFDYIAFSKFYPEVWHPKNLRVEEAFLTLNTKLKAVSNDLTIDWLFTLEKISFADSSQEGSNSRMKILKTIIAFFQKEDSRPQYRFVYKTKLDSPWQFFPSLLQDLRSSLPIGPALIAEAIIEKTKDKISKNASEVIEKTKETISKGVEGVKKMTVNTAIDAIGNTVESFKSIISPTQGNLSQEE